MIITANELDRIKSTCIIKSAEQMIEMKALKETQRKEMQKMAKLKRHGSTICQPSASEIVSVRLLAQIPACNSLLLNGLVK